MREIKFRAWYKPQNEMVDSERLESINFEVKTIGAYIVKDGKGFNKLRTSDFELMQFTGLKDKNGKEIFEGDFIKLPEFYETREATNETFTITGHIEFKDGAWMFSDSGFLYEEYTSYDGNFEVVGNIYENAELLEDAK